jgi:hypothetical protein
MSRGENRGAFRSSSTEGVPPFIHPIVFVPVYSGSACYQPQHQHGLSSGKSSNVICTDSSMGI